MAGMSSAMGTVQYRGCPLLRRLGTQIWPRPPAYNRPASLVRAEEHFMNRRLVLSAAAAVLATGVLWAQQAPAPAPAPAAPQGDTPPVVFRVEIDFVEADAYVVDAQNNPVKDLTADDFEVIEDGKPQKVTSF